MTLTPGRLVILPQTPPTVLRQSGEAPTHIVCVEYRVCTRRHVISLPRCRKVLCLAAAAWPPVWLNAHFAVTAGSGNAIYGADVCHSQQCATLFTCPRRSRLAMRWHSSVLNLLLHPRHRRVILHAGNTGASGRSKRWRNGYTCRGRASPSLFRDDVATTPPSRVNNAAPANRRPDPVAWRCR